MRIDSALTNQLLHARHAMHQSERLIMRVRRPALRHDYEQIIKLGSARIAESRNLLRL